MIQVLVRRLFIATSAGGEQIGYTDSTAFNAGIVYHTNIGGNTGPWNAMHAASITTGGDGSDRRLSGGEENYVGKPWNYVWIIYPEGQYYTYSGVPTVAVMPHLIRNRLSIWKVHLNTHRQFGYIVENLMVHMALGITEQVSLLQTLS